MKLTRFLQNRSSRRSISVARRLSRAVRSTHMEALEGRALFTGVIDSPLVITPGQRFAEGLNLDRTEIAAFSDTVKDPIGNYSGTIDWGDGSPVEAATDVNYHTDTELYWVAGTHVYGNPGSYSITATIFDGPPGGANTSTKTSVGGPIIIYPVNDAPTGTNEPLGTIFEDSGPHTYSFASLLANDSAGPSGESDEDAQSLTITGISNVVGGAAVISGNNVIFTPAANYNGPASFTYTLRDNGRTGPDDSIADDFKTATATASFTVAEVNDAPTAAADSLSSVAEDSGARNIAFSTLLSNDGKGASNESGQTLTISSVANAVGGTVAISGGNVVFTPASNFNGVASFDYVVQDNGTTNGIADPKSTTSTAFFNVTPVNDAPTAQDDTQSAVAEDSGARTISFAALLGNDSTGPANESDQSLTITAVGNAIGGTVAISGTNVIFTPTADYNGAASFSYTTQDNGATGNLADPRNVQATVSFNITEANDTPIAGNDAIGTFAEDTTAIFVTPDTLLRNDTPGPPNEASQSRTITSVGSAVGGSVAFEGGNIVFRPTLNYFGPASYTYTVQDNGTTNGVADPKSAKGSVSLTITEVNDAPTADNIVYGSFDEDTPSITVSGASLLAGDTAGPANESDQTLTITGVSNFIGGTAEIVNGDVVFHPAPNFNGIARFKYTVTDNGTTNGVADPKSTVASVRFNITPVNDAPTFALGANPTAAEDSGAQTIANFASPISPGPADEASQTVAFTVTNNSNASLFAVAPTLSPSGALSFTPAADAFGSATITVVAKDNGGGSDTSAPQTFIITVSPVNDAPTTTADAKSGFEGTPLTFPSADLTGNDSAGPANESAQTLTVTAVSAASAQGGTVSIDSGGVITYTPPANYSGPDSFTYTVRDNGQTGSPAADDFKTAIGTVNVTVAPVNHAPTAAPQSVSVTEDGSVPITLSGTDDRTAAGALVFKITSLPTAGILKVNGVPVTLNQSFTGAPSNLTYEPGATNDSPTNDSFTYTITDDGIPTSNPLTSGPATVSITATKAVADRAVTIDSAGVVRVGGTSGNDVITIESYNAPRKQQFLRVYFGNTVISDNIPLASVNELRVWSREGNDVVNSTAKVRTYINGGSGNDGLKSDGQSDVVFGASGDDILYSGSGNDLLIGGTGKDSVIAGAGKDILIGGRPAASNTLAALRQVAANWATSGSTFARSAAGLAFAQSVSDTEADKLYGGSSADWFIVNQSSIDQIVGGADSRKGDNVRYI